MSEKLLKPGLIGRKIGMTQFFTSTGKSHAVTVLEVGPCLVTQVKDESSDGYNAIQMGFGETEFRRVNRAIRGHFEKKKSKAFKFLKEFRVGDPGSFKVGQEFKVNAFQVGDRVDVSGVSKGKGFQGVIKRHHKGGGPASHGSHFHRTTGSIGQRTWPGRVFKLMKLPGHMGSKKVTVRNLEVIEVVPEKNYLVVHGAIPGSRNSIVFVKSLLGKDFEKRLSPSEPEKGKEADKKEDKKEAKKESGATA